jgi:flagellar biosynthetic protein FliR
MAPVFSVTSEQLAAWLVAFLWPFVRILALLSTAPITSEASVPRQVRVALAALLTLVIAPTLGPLPQIPVVSAAGIWLLVKQVLIGMAMGFAMRLVFAAVLAAGEYISLQMGLSFAAFFDPSSGGQTMVVGRFLNMLAMLLFLAVDGHLLMLGALGDSFHTLPISDAPFASAGWMALVLEGGHVFTTGLMLALPLVTALLTLNLAMGILNRASPQFSIFAVGFPLTLLAGIGLLSVMVPHFLQMLQPRFTAALEALVGVVRALGG